ncbi:SAG-related sequence [Besnoitia besnoiti]|uniref:SAG-related sequence n=1 Tax=Besnoitia besnoiti TaxID=94643 RepID=A0A2A9MIC6_BESBE|nr:SAG-related sequence [Besnoitia besnoiti]PFH35337.1 SAG-related sequence [Besnoitia besnoiti]
MAISHVRAQRLAFGIVFTVGLLSSRTLNARTAEESPPSTPQECQASGGGITVTVDANTREASFACGQDLINLWPNNDKNLISFCKDRSCTGAEDLVNTFGSKTTLKVISSYEATYEVTKGESAATIYTLNVGGLLKEPKEIYFICANKDYSNTQERQPQPAGQCLVTVLVPQQLDPGRLNQRI